MLHGGEKSVGEGEMGQFLTHHSTGDMLTRGTHFLLLLTKKQGGCFKESLHHSINAGKPQADY